MKEDSEQLYTKENSDGIYKDIGNNLYEIYKDIGNNLYDNKNPYIPELFTYNLSTRKVKINIDQIASFVKMMRTKSDNGKHIIEELSSVKSPSSDYTPYYTPDYTPYDTPDTKNNYDEHYKHSDNYGGKSYRKKMRHPHKKSVKKHHKKTHRKLKNKHNKSHKKH
jgi:hypothetical protein